MEEEEKNWRIIKGGDRYDGVSMLASCLYVSRLERLLDYI